MILRKDPPAASALLQTSRQVEHDLIEAVRAHTNVPISQSYGVEMDASVFGEPAMLIQRMPGSGHTSNLFNEGADVGQADDVMRHLCEVMPNSTRQTCRCSTLVGRSPTHAASALTPLRGTRT